MCKYNGCLIEPKIYGIWKMYLFEKAIISGMSDAEQGSFSILEISALYNMLKFLPKIC